ncbi:MAG TPA: hypothetical protein VFA32_12130, partial [Dehalococcoidia bacterium]|nr:hypothetical protein [Dehalococcoidia bacterium]
TLPIAHAEEPQSEFAIQINYHTARLVTEVIAHPEFAPEARDSVLLELRYLQNLLLDLERTDQEPLPEKIAMLQAHLKEIHRYAPKWVMDRIRAIFSEHAFSASLGAAIGAALTKMLS